MRKTVLILLILLTATVAYAQNKSRIVGTVTTAGGAVIVGVKVTITSDALIAGSMSTETGDRGIYRFAILPVGTYDIKFEKEGYKTVDYKGVWLGHDATATVDQVLEPSEFEELILITGEAPLIDKTYSGISDKLRMDFLQNTPNIRNIWDMPNLTAGFTDNSAFGGIQSSGQAYNTDGVNVSNPEWGTAFMAVNFEAVEQLDIAMFGAPAEYGSFTGASLNVVTKSGGNDFHGEINLFAQREDWVSDNTFKVKMFGITLPESRNLNNPAIAIGGPIIKDKIWFFANYNYQKYVTDRELLTKIITQTENPRQSFLKLSSNWNDQNITYLTWMYQTNNLSHALGDIGAWHLNFESTLSKNENMNNSYILQHSFAANENFILEARWTDWKSEEKMLPSDSADPSKPMKKDMLTGLPLPDANANQRLIGKLPRQNLLLTSNIFSDDFMGSHAFKIGFEYERSRSAMNMGGYVSEEYMMGMTGMKTVFNGLLLDTVIKRYSGYAQDSWSVNDRLTLNLGVRLDKTGEYIGETTLGKIGVSDNTIVKLTDIAPRIGFAYDLFGDGKTVLRGAFGRYYEGTVVGVFGNTTVYGEPVEVYMGQAMLGPFAPEWTLFMLIDLTSPMEIADNIDNNFTQGFLIGIERQLANDMSASVNFVFKKDYNLIGMIHEDAEYMKMHADYDGPNGSYHGDYYIRTVPDDMPRIMNIHKGGKVMEEPFRKYYGLMFDLDKRFSNNWTMKANYTYSRNTANIGSDANYIRNINSWDHPNQYINTTGRSRIDRPHVFKLSGTYIAPFDISISPIITYKSGYPYAKRYYIGYTEGTINSKPMDGKERYPEQINVDVRLEKSFVFGERYRLGILFDAFNLLNDDAVTSYMSTTINFPTYLTPMRIVPPRFYQFGVRFTF